MNTRKYLSIAVMMLLLGALLAGCQNNRTVDGSSGKSLATVQGMPLSIDVVSNRLSNKDKHTATVSVAIVSQPANGTATARSDNLITYQPDTEFVGRDSFIYQINTLDSAPIVASLTIDVVCPGCKPVGRSLTLSWLPVTGSSDPISYIVYYGFSADATTQIAMETQQTEVTLDPSVHMSVQPGETVCFRLRAKNSTGISDFSAPACMVYS